MKSLAHDADDNELKKILEGRGYYYISIFVDENGDERYSAFGEGFAVKTRPLREIRRGALVDPWRMAGFLKTARDNFIVVNDEKDAEHFKLIRGHAFVLDDVAHSEFSCAIEPVEVVRLTQAGSFRHISDVPRSVLRRIDKVTRSKVLRRDNYQCKKCKRSPCIDRNIKLHVHHIEPWVMGGLTVEWNLITLCKECHYGLKPHFDPSLFSWLEKSK